LKTDQNFLKEEFKFGVLRCCSYELTGSAGLLEFIELFEFVGLLELLGLPELIKFIKFTKHCTNPVLV
jgi:hypothetical protein